MVRSLFHFLSAMAAITAAYYLYVAIAVPMIEGDEVAAKESTNVVYTQQKSTFVDNSHLIEGLIPEDSWEHQGCKIVETKQGLVLFKEYTFEADGRVVVEPFTMIAMNNSEALNSRGRSFEQKEPPVILRSSKGAVLVFDGDASGGASGGLGFGNLIGGQLPEDVEISRKPSSPDAEDGFHLTAHNVQIDGPNIITPHEVEFRFGNSYGSGRDLKIVLDENENTDPTQSRSLTDVKGIKSVELATLHELMIQTKEGLGSFNETTQPQISTVKLVKLSAGKDVNKEKSKDENEWTRVSVKCSGGFLFDFETSIATFSDKVHIERFREDQKNETLDCQRLNIIFDGKFFEDEAQAAARKKKNIKKEQPQIRRIVATGKPAIMNMPERNAIARAASIEFEIATEKVKLRDPVAVTLRDPQHEIVAPQLEYTLGKGGRLGVGWAPGPGRIEKFAKGDDEGFVATWGVEMNIRPHEGKAAISFYERAHIKMGADKEFDAGELHLWLWEIADVDSAGQIRKGRWRLLPAQMLATDDVSFQTDRVFGTTQQARGFWPKPSAFPVNNEKQEDEPKVESQASNGAKDLLVSNRKDGEKPKNMWRVSTGQADFHLSAENKLQLLELIDSVEIREHSVPYTRDNLVIQGDSLIVTPAKLSEMFKINVIGKPAVIAGRSQTMYGNVITFDQERNEIVVPGEGKMRIEDLGELNLLGNGEGKEQAAVANPTAGPQFVRPEEEKREKSVSIISWQKSLKFDGRKVVLTGGANVRTRRHNKNGEFSDVDATAGQITATLDQPIDFRKTKLQSNAPKPQVTILNLLQQVDIKSHTFVDKDTRKSFERITGEEMAINVKTGDVTSVTAGAVETVRMGKIGVDESFVGETVRTAERGLNYLQVHYAAGFSGNIFRKEMAFHRRVRAIHGPVSNWAQKLDIDQNYSNPKISRMECDQLSVGQWQPGPDAKASIEMQAAGNVKIISSQFSTNSDTVAFYQDSDMLVLQGNPAKISYRTSPKSSPEQAEAREIKYWRKRGQIEVAELEKMEYTTQEPLRQRTNASGGNTFQPPRVRGQ